MTLSLSSTVRTRQLRCLMEFIARTEGVEEVTQRGNKYSSVRIRFKMTNKIASVALLIAPYFMKACIHKACYMEVP